MNLDASPIVMLLSISWAFTASLLHPNAYSEKSPSTITIHTWTTDFAYLRFTHRKSPLRSGSGMVTISISTVIASKCESQILHTDPNDVNSSTNWVKFVRFCLVEHPSNYQRTSLQGSWRIPQIRTRSSHCSFVALSFCSTVIGRFLKGKLWRTRLAWQAYILKCMKGSTHYLFRFI